MQRSASSNEQMNNKYLLSSLASCKALVKTWTGPAKSRRSNLGCRATSTSMGSSATALVFDALIVTVGKEFWVEESF